MHQFKDNKDRTWNLDLNVTVVKRVRAVCQVNLAQITQDVLLQLQDPVLLCDVLFVVCQEQAQAQSVSDEEFGRGLSGDAIDQAVQALMAELVDFTRSPVQRELYRKSLAKGRELEKQAATELMEYMDSGALETKIRGIIKTGIEAPSEPTQPTTPSSE